MEMYTFHRFPMHMSLCLRNGGVDTEDVFLYAGFRNKVLHHLPDLPKGTVGVVMVFAVMVMMMVMLVIVVMVVMIVIVVMMMVVVVMIVMVIMVILALPGILLLAVHQHPHMRSRDPTFY